MKLKHFSGTGTIYRSARLTRTLLGIGIAAMFSLTCYRFSQLREGADAAQTRSTLAGMIGADGTYSVGYNHGQILSIDGKEIAVDYETTSGWSKFCGVPGYNGVLGSSGSGGAITEWHDVLYSSSDPINREMRCGNMVQTTLSSSGQETAAALLASLCPDTICDSAALAVVLRDGAVLVAAGNNYCTPEDYFRRFTKITRCSPTRSVRLPRCRWRACCCSMTTCFRRSGRCTIRSSAMWTAL